MADDDQQIEIGLVSIFRLIHPIGAGIAAEQDDLLDLAIALPRLAGPRRCLGKFCVQDFLDPIQFGPLDIGR
jgi:hypothetical protein